MEAVTAIIKNLLQNVRTVLIVGVILGLILGLIIGWGLWPVQWTDGTPEVLRADLQDDYLRMAVDSYSRTGDINVAVRRWEDMGSAAPAALSRVQSNPGNVDPNAVQQYRTVIETAKGPIQVPTTSAPTETSGLSTWVILGSLVVLVAVGAGTLYLLRLFRKSSG